MIENGATRRMWLNRWNKLGERVAALIDHPTISLILRIVFFPVTLIYKFLTYVFRNTKILLTVRPDTYESIAQRSKAFQALFPVFMLIGIVIYMFVLAFGTDHLMNAPNRPVTTQQVKSMIDRGACEKQKVLELIARNNQIKKITTARDIKSIPRSCEEEGALRAQEELAKELLQPK